MYRIVNLEIEDPPEAITFRDGETGLALILRHRRRLVGFVLHPRADRAGVPAAHLAELIAREAAERVLAARVRSALPPGAPPRR
ncbi:hypothetical protein, partial [Falsiroseomonas oryzae]|uniref:hypothetical protein n=1 Tax=Falsiroseomonas oryzae TaxID=2766473 RepID=UPI0022EA11E2